MLRLQLLLSLFASPLQHAGGQFGTQQDMSSAFLQAATGVVALAVLLLTVAAAAVGFLHCAVSVFAFAP